MPNEFDYQCLAEVADRDTRKEDRYRAAVRSSSS